MKKKTLNIWAYYNISQFEIVQTTTTLVVVFVKARGSVEFYSFLYF